MGALSGKFGAVYKEYTGTDKSKEIANFQDAETWTSGAGTQADDSTNFRLGTESIRITENDGTGGLLYSDRNSASYNLNQFADASASDSADYIYYIFYVSDATGFDADATYDGTNGYIYTITSVVTGWNYVKIKKSAFTSNGSPDWASVDSMRVGWTSTASATGAYISFQSLYLLDDSKTYDFALINNTAYTLECMTAIYNWTVDAQTDVADVTSFLCDGVQFKEFIPLLNMFTVSSEAFWGNGDFLDNLQSDFILSLYIDTVNGYRYDGLGKLTSDNISNDVADVVNETIEFQGDGDLKYVDVQIIDS
jgi:hypothetical protein